MSNPTDGKCQHFHRRFLGDNGHIREWKCDDCGYIARNKSIPTPQSTGEKKNHNCLCSGIVGSSYDDGNFVRCGKCHGILPEQKPTGERNHQCYTHLGYECPQSKPTGERCDDLTCAYLKGVDDGKDYFRTYMKGELGKLVPKGLGTSFMIGYQDAISDAINLVKGEL